MSTQRESSKIPKHHASNVEVPAPQPVQMINVQKLDQIPRPTIPAAPEPAIDPARFAGTQVRENPADLADARFDVAPDGRLPERSADARVDNSTDARLNQADAHVDGANGGRLPAKASDARVASRSTVIK